VSSQTKSFLHLKHIFIFLQRAKPSLKRNNSRQRIIFQGGIKYSQQEYETISDFKDYLADNDLEYPQDDFDDSELLRFLQVSKFDFKNTYAYINKYVEWREQHIPPKLTDLCETLIKSGFMYVHGRDRRFRPLIVINPTALLLFKNYDQELLGSEIIKC